MKLFKSRYGLYTSVMANLLDKCSADNDN